MSRFASVGVLIAWLGLISGTSAEEPTHWAFQPLHAPVPSARPDESARGPIDVLIASRLRQAGLSPAKLAEPRDLVRRLKLVMEGLPPTPDEVDAFATDTRIDAWERLVDRTLASPAYGERWGRHWLDLVRFGETDGFETNRERPHAFHYRDWVIDALNADLPYDQFVMRQIAGDRLGDPLGTGFLVAGPHDIVKSPDINLTLMQRQDELADIINATGTAFLGLTLGCARCHDHKFDPVSQRDYYSIQAVFAGVRHGERSLPVSDAVQTDRAALDREIFSLREELSPFVPDGVPTREPVSASHNVDRFEPTLARFVRFVILETNASEPCIDELEVFAGERNVALASEGTKVTCSSTLPGHAIHQRAHINDGKYGNAHSWISNEPGKGWVQLEFSEPVTVDRVEWARDREGKYQDRLPIRYRIEVATEQGQWRSVADSDDRRPVGATHDETEYRFDDLPEEQAARMRSRHQRLRAAINERKTLTTPVTAYVGTFTQPESTHILHRGEPTERRDRVSPGTIDALGNVAMEEALSEHERRLIFARWVMREETPLPARVIVNRLWQFHFGQGIVATSSDFGGNGVPPTHPRLLDYLALRMRAADWSPKRLHREILLSRTWQQSSQPNPEGLRVDAGGRLWWRFPPRRLEAEAIRDSILSVSGRLDRHMGGPGFSAFEVQRENVRHYFPKKSFGPEDWRRMIYMSKVRQEQDAVFGAFDCPDATQVVDRRSRSTTPLQALNLFNSPLMMLQASAFASRLEAQSDEVGEQVVTAYRLCFLRRPTDLERTEAQDFIVSHGLTMYCRAMLNANEFLFIP